MYKYMYVRTFIYICRYIHLHIYSYIRDITQFVRTLKHTYALTQTYTYTLHTYAHTITHTYARARTCTYFHRYILILCVNLGPLDEADTYSTTPLFRVKNWMGFYGNRKCQGYYQRGICVFGIGDLPWLAVRPELIANKFNLTYQFLTLDCLEERHRTRTMLRYRLSSADERLIRNLPTVKYGRKDGLFLAK